MKQFLKNAIAQMVYFLYRLGIKKCNIKVHTVEDTIELLLTTQKSMVRFGDGEITMIRGRSLKLQQTNTDLTEDLKRILHYDYDDMIVTIPDIFNDLSIYRKESRQFWKEHLLFSRKTYEKYYDFSKEYYNTSISRFYLTLQDKTQCKKWIKDIRCIWKDKAVVIVEGEKTHNGVGNNLLDMAKSVERIIGPSSDAFENLDEILIHCRKHSHEKLFLISLGAAAKPLSEKLFLEGYRVLDIGNLDMEYEWYLSGTQQKVEVKKHECIGIEANIAAGYTEYLKQIIARVEK